MRVLSLYKAWCRHLPYMIKVGQEGEYLQNIKINYFQDFGVPRSEAECKAALRFVTLHFGGGVCSLKTNLIKDINLLGSINGHQIFTGKTSTRTRD